MEQTTHTEPQENLTPDTREIATTNVEVSTRHTVHTKKNKLGVPSSIIIAAIILSVSHVLYATILNTKNTGTATVFKGSPISEKDFPTGDEKSDVVVVEYSDTECPFCARVHPTLSQIYSEYRDRVSFVYRYFPLTQIHPDAFVEAQSIECIGKQLGSEKRRSYITQMFAHKITNNSMVMTKGVREELARNLGADMKTFISCVSSEESSVVVNNSIQDGVTAGVSGTPATFILKRDGDDYEVFALIEGAREYEYFKAALEDALK
jgi:protein-disulfide isomerase